MNRGLDIFFIILFLSAGVFVYSLIFWLLTNKEIPYARALKLSCAALVMNKFLFTGFGYAAISGVLKKDDFPLHKSLSAFALSEIFVIAPWVASGLYFGATVAFKIPLFFIAILALAAACIVYKRKKAILFFRQAAAYAGETSIHLKFVVPLAIINILFSALYYYFLFDGFGARVAFPETLKIISVSFTVGYLSPLPSGLGFREGSLIFFLMQQGCSFGKSFAIALADRSCVTVFYALIALLCGPQIILQALGKARKG